MTNNGPSLVVQQLRFCASNAGDSDSIRGRKTKIPHAMRGCQKKLKVNFQDRRFFLITSKYMKKMFNITSH